MATRIYLPSSGAPAVSPAYDGAWADTGGAGRILAQVERTDTTFAEVTRAETSDVVHNVLLRQFVVGPLAAQIIGGTVKGQVLCRQSATAADMRAQMVVRVVSNDGATERGTLRAADAGALSSEWNHVRLRNCTLPLAALSPEALAAVEVQDGDWLVIELGYRAHNTSTTSYTGRMQFGTGILYPDLPEDEASSATFNPWVEFSADIAWQLIEQRVTQVAAEVDLSIRVPLRVSQVLLEVDVEPPAATPVVLPPPYLTGFFLERAHDDGS